MIFLKNYKKTPLYIALLTEFQAYRVNLCPAFELVQVWLMSGRLLIPQRDYV